MLLPIDKAWQPADYLPDLEAENWREQVERVRQTAQAISESPTLQPQHPSRSVQPPGLYLVSGARHAHSHGNVGRLADQEGDANLARICRIIASDEARHETFYTRMMAQVLEHDPAGGILSFRSMLRGLIKMPGRLMDDGRDPDLFERFAIVAQRSGVYTVRDYASILDHLVRTWNIARPTVTGDAAEAQDERCRLAERLELLADRISATIDKQPQSAFSWIRDRKA